MKKTLAISYVLLVLGLTIATLYNGHFFSGLAVTCVGSLGGITIAIIIEELK